VAILGAALITVGDNWLADDEPPTTSVRVVVALSPEKAALDELLV